jgi:crotonobetainyl-CoA:carnitine CoA-transferase CaiB-like acyl-CoA transferase
MEKVGIPAGPVLAYDEVFTDPHVLARNMWVATEHEKAGRFHTMGVPVKLSETPGAVRRAAPALGQHNAEVLGGKKSG